MKIASLALPLALLTTGPGFVRAQGADADLATEVFLSHFQKEFDAAVVTTDPLLEFGAVYVALFHPLVTMRQHTLRSIFPD